MLDYFNPNSTNPTSQMQGPLQGPLASGPLGGFYAGQDRQRYQQMANLQQMLVQLEERKKREEMEEGYPQRQAERGYKTTDFQRQQQIGQQALRTPGYAPSMVGGEMGVANQNQAKGRVALGTVDSDILAGNEKNLTQVGDDRYKRLVTHMDTYTPALMNASPIDPNTQNIYNQFRKGLPGPLQSKFPEQFNPAVTKTLMGFREHLVNSVPQQRAVGLQNVKDIADQKRQDSVNRTAIEVANIRITNKNKSYEQLLRESKGDDYAALRIVASIESDDEASPELKQRARAVGAQAQRNLAARADRGSFAPGDLNNPNAIGDRVRDRLNPNAAAAEQKRYIPGQVYKDSKGQNRRYIGPANPTPQQLKDPKNWPKI